MSRRAGRRTGRRRLEQSACPREQEIVDLLVSRRLADEGDDALLAHAAHCGACAETLELAHLLREDQLALCGDAPVPAAGSVWWRATIRARAEAARTAGQPMTLLQGIAAATAVGLLVGLDGAWWRSIVPDGAWLDRFGALASRLDEGRAQLATAAAIPGALGLPLLLALAACLILAPVAVYLATADEP
jgi:hypothetical protein